MRILTSLILCFLLAGCVFDGSAMKYRFVSSGQNVDDALVVTQTLLGTSLKLPPPANLRAVRNASGDVLFMWDRRARIAPGLRPGSDIPVAEETSQWVLEVYSGSTLKRTIYVNGDTLRTEPVMWAPMLFVAASPTISSDGSIQFGATSQDTVRSLQPLRGDFTLDIGPNSANTKMPAFNIVTFPDRTIYAGLQRNFGDANSAFALVGPTAGTTTANITYPNRFQISRVGPTLHFYQVSGTHRHLINSSPLQTLDPLVVLCYDESAESTYVSKATLTYAAPSTMYYAAEQIENFGSTQAPIKIRVMQVSSVTGVGFYTEATL